MPAPLVAVAAGAGRAAIQGAARGAAQGAAKGASRGAARAGQGAMRSPPRTGNARTQSWQRSQGQQNRMRLQRELEQRQQQQQQEQEEEEMSMDQGDGEGAQAKQANMAEKMLQKPLTRFLQRMWMATATVKGALIGVPYINLHFVMHYMGGPLSKFFCAPGEEWDFGTGVQAMTGGATPMTKLLGYAEIIAIIAIDVLIAFLIGLTISLLSLIVNAYLHPLDTFTMFWGAGLSFFWELINPAGD